MQTEQLYTASGMPVKDIYTPEDIQDLDYDKDLGIAGKPPFTRGPYPSMYRGQVYSIGDQANCSQHVAEQKKNR